MCSAAGAERFAIHVPSKRVWTATEFAGHKGHDAVVAWLNRSHDWMELHHLETLTVMRTLALLRGGASLEVKSEKRGHACVDRSAATQERRGAAQIAGRARLTCCGALVTAYGHALADARSSARARAALYWEAALQKVTL